MIRLSLRGWKLLPVAPMWHDCLLSMSHEAGNVPRSLWSQHMQLSQASIQSLANVGKISRKAVGHHLLSLYWVRLAEASRTLATPPGQSSTPTSSVKTTPSQQRTGPSATSHLPHPHHGCQGHLWAHPQRMASVSSRRFMQRHSQWMSTTCWHAASQDRSLAGELVLHTFAANDFMCSQQGLLPHISCSICVLSDASGRA